MSFNFFRPQDKTQHNTCPDRRRFLQLGLGATTALSLPNAFAGLPSSSIAQAERKLSLLNLHTGEHLRQPIGQKGNIRPAN